jgi:hypothetical protein
MDTLMAEKSRRNPVAATEAAAGKSTLASGGAGSAQVTNSVARPTGLPLSQGYFLQPLPDAYVAQLGTQLGEGQIVRLPMGSPSTAGKTPPSLYGTALDASIISTTMSVNLWLESTGFAAAGENAIGLVGIPRLGTAGQFLPESLNVLGHTAVYARVGGRIVVVRGFTMAKTPSSLINLRGIEQGIKSAPGVLAEDAALFTNTGAMSIEYPVTAEMAEALAKGLPPPGPAGMAYTARPAVNCMGSNCVMWATQQAESQLGGSIGTVGAEGHVIPISSVGKGGAVVPGTGSQGRLMGLMKDVAAGETSAAPVEGALGEAVASGMPRYISVFKWGGRVFFVVGLATIPYEVYKAPPRQRVRTAVTASSGFLGGLAGGALAGLACGPGFLVCSIVLGIGFGTAGYFAARGTAEVIYDAATE